MLRSTDVEYPCPDCEYTDLNRQVSFVDDGDYPERIRCCADCSVTPSEDCIAPLSIFYGMCMDCIDVMAEHMLRECVLCQFLWKTLRAMPPLERVCKPCLPLYSLQREVWLLYGPVRLRIEVELGPDCQICTEKQKHQFLYTTLQRDSEELCDPCLAMFQPSV